MGWDSLTFSAFQRWQNQYDQKRIEHLIPEEISHVGLEVGIRFSNTVYQLGFIFLYWEHSGNLN